MTRTRYGKGKHPLDVYCELGGQDPRIKEYLGGFRVSNCPGCGGVHYTPRGDPVMCPKCTGPEGTLSRTSVPMGIRDVPEGES